MIENTEARNTDKEKHIQIGSKKINFFLLAILIVSISAFITEAYFVSKIEFIGSADPAHYSEVAENVILGKGFVMDYINQYLYKFDSITHPEEYGFPGVSLLMVPFILLLGKTVFAIKLPSMIIGIILFPILTYYLGKEFFDEKIGFLAAISMIFYPRIFQLSFGGERDTMFAFFIVAGIYFFYRGLKTDQTKYFLLMGVFLGYSYLIRQAAIAVLPVIFIAYYLTKKNFSMKFVYGLLIGGLFVMPWLIRNYLVFGDPFFTVNKYAGWVIGYASYFEQAFFKIYWNSPKPSASFLIELVGPAEFIKVYSSRIVGNLAVQHTKFIILNALAFFGLAFIRDREETQKTLKWTVPLVFSGIIIFLFIKFFEVNYAKNLLYGLLLVAPYFGILIGLVLFYRKDRIENNIFILLWIFYAIFFGFLWVTDIRYWTAIVPFLLIYSWAMAEKLLGEVRKQTAKLIPEEYKIEKVLLAILIIFILISLPQTFGKFLDKDAPFPYRDDNTSALKMQLAENIEKTTERNAVIMGCDVAVLHYYNGRSYVELPSGRIENIAEIVKIYNASYFTLLGCERRLIDIEFYNLVLDYEWAEEDYSRGTIEFISGNYETESERRGQVPTNVALKVYKINIKEIRNNNRLQRIWDIREAAS